MTVPIQGRTAGFDGPVSALTPLTIPFMFLDNLHIGATLTDLDGGNPQVLTTGQYSLAGAGNPTGGTITPTVAWDATRKLVVTRTVPATQETAYVEAAKFPAATHERALDKLTLIVQDLQETLSRAAVTDINGPPGAPLVVPSAELNKFLAWDGNAPTGVLVNVDGPAAPELPETVVQQQYHDVTAGPQSNFDTQVPTSGDLFITTDPRSIQVFSLEFGAVERRQLLSFEKGDYSLPGGNIIQLAAPLSTGGTLSVYRYNELTTAANVVEDTSADGIKVAFDISPLNILNQSELEVLEDGVRVPYTEWSLTLPNEVTFTVAPTQELAFVPRLGKTGATGPQGPTGLGDVTGPAASTINALPKYSDATGKVIVDSNVTVDAGGNLTTPGNIGAALVNGRDLATDGAKLDGVEALAEVNNISDPDATDLTDGGDTSLHHHDSFYYRKTEHINVSTGAPDAAKPVVTDSNGQIDPSMMSLQTLAFQGNWDANTNTPALADGGVGGSQNHYYQVSVSGSTSLDGISDWVLGDWIVNTGAAWIKIDNTDKVTSVAAKTGAVVLDMDDLSETATGKIFSDTERTKLTGIESGATADQSDAEIKTAYENNADTNAFTDADETKLDGIEAGATADQTGAEIKSAYEGEANTNAFTDAEQTKLAGIESGATADQSDAEIKTAYENNADTNAFTDAEQTKLTGIEAGATADQSDAEIETAYNNQVAIVPQAEAEAGTSTTVRRWTAERVKQAIAALESPAGTGDVAGPGSAVDENIAVFDSTTGKLIKDSGINQSAVTANTAKVSADGSVTTHSDVTDAGSGAIITGAERTKLSGIETAATADQTGAEIKAAYEGEANTNAYTDAEVTKVGHLSVTQAVNLDTMESDIATNNAKVTNATHTGEVTGSGALTLANTSISNKTNVTAAATDEILIGDASDAGNLKKVTAQSIADLAPGANQHISAYKTVDENVINSTTLQNDDHLVLVGLVAGRQYQFKCLFFAKEDANNPNIKFDFNAEGGLVLNDFAYHTFSVGTAPQDLTAFALNTVHPFILTTTYEGFVVEGTIDVTTGGDLRFRWAQDTLDAADNATVRMGSFIEAVQI